MKILIASGGTGGHFYPGFAAAEKLRQLGWDVLFVLREGDPAVKTLDEAGFASAEIPAAALPRTINPLKHAAFLRKLFKCFFVCRHIVKDWRPDAALGTGGYASFPTVLAASLAGVPVLLHESNAKLGISNLMSLPLAKKIALGLPVSGVGDKAFMAGTPVRPQFRVPLEKATARRHFGLDENRPVLLVFGGSQGALALNMKVCALAKQEFSGPEKPQLLHITGRRDFEKIKALYGVLPDNIKILPYCEEMNSALRACDLALCRSGASTMAELCALKKPAVLVPLPHSAAEHQKANALVLARAGAAELIEQDTHFENNIKTSVLRLLHDPAALEYMSDAFRDAEIPDPFKAADVIAECAAGLAKAA